MKKFTSVMRMGARGFLGMALAGLLFTACKKDHNDNNNNTPVSGLMVFNLAPDVVSAGFRISGNNLTYNPLAFNNYSGGYLSIYSGSRPLEAFNLNSGSSLATTTYSFDSARYYSAFLVGTDSNYQNVIVNDNFDSLSPSTQSFVRYINAIPDASSPTVTIAANGTNVVNDPAAFASVSAFKAVTPGSIVITVTNGGTINVNRTITVEQGKVYTVLLGGKPGGTGDYAVQIKYIVNGSLAQSSGRIGSSSVKRIN